MGGTGLFIVCIFTGRNQHLLSVLILGEYSGWQQWLGGGLVISGMILIGTGSIPAKVFQLKSTKEQEV